MISSHVNSNKSLRKRDNTHPRQSGRNTTVQGSKKVTRIQSSQRVTSGTRRDFNETFNAVATFTSLGALNRAILNENIQKTAKFDKSLQKEDNEEALSSTKIQDVQDGDQFHYQGGLVAQPLQSSKHDLNEHIQYHVRKMQQFLKDKDGRTAS